MIFANAIDAHVHLWDPARNDDILILGTEPWLTDEGVAGRLRHHIAETGVAGAIVVQSAPSLEHSDWLRAAARSVGGLIGIVAWIDPTANDAMDHVDRLSTDEMVCGVRLMLNRMERSDVVLERESMECLGRLADAGLAIECLAPPHRLGTVGALARALPRAQLVVDHCGLPPASEDPAEWRDGISDLATCQNVSAKFSGLIEPFGTSPRISDIEGYAQHCLDLFGPMRLMAASNHPVCQMGGGTSRWAEMLADIIEKAELSKVDRSDLLAGTALRVFQRAQTGKLVQGGIHAEA